VPATRRSRDTPNGTYLMYSRLWLCVRWLSMALLLLLAAPCPRLLSAPCAVLSCAVL